MSETSLETACALIGVVLAELADQRAHSLLDRVALPLAIFAGPDHRPRLINHAWRQRFAGGLPSIPVSAAELDQVMGSQIPQPFDDGIIYPVSGGVMIACPPPSRQAVERDQLFAVVAHELRAPITAILVWERVLRDEQLPDASLRALDAIRDSANQQARLVADLFDIARASRGTLHVDRKVLPIARVLTAAVQAAELAARAKHQQLACELGVDLGFVAGDADRLGQILGNLLTNAVNHTAERGHISVVARHDTDSIVIAIADTGRGIAPDFLPRVFDAFSQADEGSYASGLGLGLAIAHELVVAHGGTLTAASPGLGQGATFTLTLPRTPESPPAIAPSAEPDLNGMRILLIDDDELVLEALQVLLEQAGAIVRTAESAAAGLDAFGQLVPDAIVSDLAMPGEDGCAFVRRLRSSSGSHVPAIAITGWSAERERGRALDAGFDVFLTKPVRVDRLIAELTRLVGLRRTGEAIPVEKS